MKRTILRFIQAITPILIAISCCGPLSAVLQAQYTPPANHRVDFNFNFDWKFIKQDVAGANATAFDDSSWATVSTPHTWNDDKFREWIFLSNDSASDPLRPSGTYYGTAWYRKHFTIPSTYTGRKVILEFQGIGRVATFYVNGQLVINPMGPLGVNESGVAPVGLDITAYVTFGSDNVIAVKVNNNELYATLGYNGAILPFGQPFNPNFGGINRDVTLHILDSIHQTLPLYRNLGTVGTYVYPTNIDTLHKNAGLTIQTEIENDSAASQTVNCYSVVVDNTGTAVLTTGSSSQAVAAGQKSTFTLSGSMTNIHFWSPDYPYLYQVYTVVTVGGTVLDVNQTPLGVRSFVFNPTFGLQINGHPLYLNGYAPRCSMEWPAVGTPVDWLNEFDFKMMKDGNTNFLRPMHIAPRKVQVEAADKFGIVMVCPAANNEGDETDPNKWQERLDDMRDVTIYYRNNPSVLFYEGCNQILTAQHMQDMLNVRLTWDPNGGRLAGLRSNDSDVTLGIREYSCTMDGAEQQLDNPLWDAEYGRGEGPRRVWDEYTPMLNPRWDGVNSNPTPAAGTVGDTTHKYLLGGYFYIASDYHQAFGFNSGMGDFIGDYLAPTTSDPTTHAYFRIQSSEDMVLQNLAKYYARYQRSVYIQAPTVSATKGVMVGGAKIIWSDSVTDGRMHDMEVTRTSGAVDGARLPKEVYYALQTAQNPNPQVYVVGHWNYAAGTVKTVYVVSNTNQVDLQTYNTSGTLIHDYGFGVQNFFPTSLFSSNGDQVNFYVYAFNNVAWQAGSIKAIGYNNSVQVATHTKTTAGAPVALRLTPTLGPSGQWMADGNDIAMFDVEVVDTNGNRCPTYEDKVTFSCSGQGTFLGGYNSGIRYSTNLNNLTSGYSLNVEAGINRVFVRASRTAGSFTLNVTGTSLTSGSASITSTAVTNTLGLATVWPQKYSVALGTEPTPVAQGTPPPPPPNSPNPAPATNLVDLHYSGANQDEAVLIEAVQPGQQVYLDSSSITFGTMPNYLVGAEFIQPFQSDAGDTSATDQYQFNITKFSYIYLAIDAANGMPNNDNNSTYNWQKLTDTMTVNGRTMNIYKSRLMGPYENGYFADNGYGVLPFNSSSNMYLVFLASAEQQLQKPGQTITATSTQGTSVAANMLDSNVNTRWNASSGTFPQVVNLDLGQQCQIGGYEINWYENPTRSFQYKVEVSPDNTTFTTSLDNTANANEGVDEFRVPAIAAFQGRYVRITVTGATSGAWAAINDLRINGVITSATQAPVPVISSTLTTSGSGGYGFSYQIAATNSPTGYDAQNLPDGLVVNGNTGLISGTTLQSGTIPVIISGINSGGAGSAVLKIVMSPPPPVPVITSGTTLTGTAGAAIATYQITASNTPSSYGASSLPTGLSVSTSTGKITGTAKYPGTYNATMTASNAGGPGSKALTVNIVPSGPAPVITSGTTLSGTAGSALSYQIAATNTPTLFGATGLPAGTTVSTSTGLISGTPTTPGTYTVTISVSNTGGTTTGTVAVTVAVNPSAPAITSGSTASGAVGTVFSYQITATNTPTSYSSTGLPPGLVTTGSTGAISGTPTTTGTYTATIKATNSHGFGTASLTIGIQVATPPPSITSGSNAVGDVGSAFSYQIVSTNNPTSYAASGLPAGLSINTSTGLISGTATGTGTTVASLTATNISGTATSSLSIAISPAGSDINLALNQQTTTSSAQNTTNVGNNAVDGNSTTTRWESQYSDLQWIYVDLGAVKTIHSVGLVWENAAGKNYTIDVSNDTTSWTTIQTVTGNTTVGLITYSGFNVTARYVRMNGTARKLTAYGYSLWEFQVFGPPGAANPAAPVITSGTAASATLGSAFSYQIAASNSPTSFNASGLPAGLGVNTSTGLISGTATSTGATSVTISAINASGTGTGPLVVTVSSPAPAITSGSTASGNVGTAFSYQITASNSPTSYSASGLPGGLTVSTSTGLISGTATAPGTTTATINAVNTSGTGSSPLVITIAGSAAPVINSGTTASTTVGSPFSYQITATNTPTSFNASGLPAGLSVSTSTGLISGTATTTGTTTATISAVNTSGTGTASLVITAVSSGDTNVGLSQPATASSVQTGNSIASGNDGSTGTRWAASDNTYPQWWRVDLGAAKTLSRLDTNWYSSASRSYKYRIETSNDDVTYTTAVDKTSNTTLGDTSDPFVATARYVRITMTGGSNAGGFASAYEFKVYGH